MVHAIFTVLRYQQKVKAAWARNLKNNQNTNNQNITKGLKAMSTMRRLGN